MPQNFSLLPPDYYLLSEIKKMNNPENRKPTPKQKKSILTGYYIERSGSVEIYLKSELIELMVSSIHSTNYQMGRLYDQSFLDHSDHLRHCFNFNSQTLVSYEGLPNLRPLLVKGLNKGVKIKIRGMFTQEEIENYQELFNKYTELFVKKYARKRGLEICL